MTGTAGMTCMACLNCMACITMYDLYDVVLHCVTCMPGITRMMSTACITHPIEESEIPFAQCDSFVANFDMIQYNTLSTIAVNCSVHSTMSIHYCDKASRTIHSEMPSRIW